MQGLEEVIGSFTESVREMIRPSVVPTEYAPYLTEEYFLREGSQFAEAQGWVPWQPAAVIGRAPTATESSALSAAVRGLERRELIRLLRARGKGQRVSHARLTFAGEVASILLRQRSPLRR